MSLPSDDGESGPRVTPGPWVAMAPMPKSFSDHGYRTVCEVSRNGEKLHVYAEAHKMWRDATGFTWGSHDAHLIAAAPDLLVLARKYAGECGQCGGSGENIHANWPAPEDEYSLACEDCAEIREVIDRAEGRS